MVTEVVANPKIRLRLNSWFSDAAFSAVLLPKSSSHISSRDYDAFSFLSMEILGWVGAFMFSSFCFNGFCGQFCYSAAEMV